MVFFASNLSGPFEESSRVRTLPINTHPPPQLEWSRTAIASCACEWVSSSVASVPKRCSSASTTAWLSRFHELVSTPVRMGVPFARVKVCTRSDSLTHKRFSLCAVQADLDLSA